MEDDEVTKARLAIGLSRDRYKDALKHPDGASIVCTCIHCGALFESRSQDLADLEHICRGDCGKHN